MFKIKIKDLKLFGYHGVKQEEKTSGQNFLFNISIDIAKDSFEKDGFYQDNILDTVNYSEIITLIKEINSNNRFNLLETFSEVLAEKIISYSPLILKVKVRIEKISPPIKESIGSVGVELELERNPNSREYEPKTSKKSIVFLSLGSNLGDREKNLRDAVKKLKSNQNLDIISISSIYETEPMYVENQEYFYNIVLKAAIKSAYSAFELLGYAKKIEFDMGRKSTYARYGPRTIDVDILTFDELKIDSDLLALPHPKIFERNFVLIPLSEISPDFMIKDKNILDYISERNFKEKVVKIKCFQ
ncbi:MAG: 2-amino-4-hydroxy-6-hydroxymethyldihydropteridine diphosphokinase [Actinobacteria bacterium]|nr:2-amino-4-hydroxy-6-hydroxymethyldihydropteridine diphosphokinase [Actinomycetota bacterium]